MIGLLPRNTGDETLETIFPSDASNPASGYYQAIQLVWIVLFFYLPGFGRFIPIAGESWSGLYHQRGLRLQVWKTPVFRQHGQRTGGGQVAGIGPHRTTHAAHERIEGHATVGLPHRSGYPAQHQRRRPH